MPCATSWGSIAARSDEAGLWPGRDAALVRRKRRCRSAEAWRSGRAVPGVEKRYLVSEAAE